MKHFDDIRRIFYRRFEELDATTRFFAFTPRNLCLKYSRQEKRWLWKSGRPEKGSQGPRFSKVAVSPDRISEVDLKFVSANFDSRIVHTDGNRKELPQNSSFCFMFCGRTATE